MSTFLPIIIFAASLFLLIWLISFRMWKTSKNTALQSESNWFKLDLIRAHDEIDHGLRSATRPHMRSLVNRMLRMYRGIVRRIRNLVRKPIQRVVRHYHEDNDPVPEQPRSQFIADIRSHKDQMSQYRDTNGIHNDFPQEDE